jgi:hypothetical protein
MNRLAITQNFAFDVRALIVSDQNGLGEQIGAGQQK